MSQTGVPKEPMAMLIAPDRVLYAGLLGTLSVRRLGSLTVYISPQRPFNIRVGENPARMAYLAIIAPNTPHAIEYPDRIIWEILVEPESTSTETVLQQLEPLITTPTANYLRIRAAFADWLLNAAAFDRSTADLDQLLFGRQLPERALDARIKFAVERIRSQPCEQFFASECARVTGLSFSRFLHLFKAEVGMAFRTFCAWKRARALLPLVKTSCNLTQLAMHTGYPDSTHFSHSIRRIYGLTPRQILAGSRRLALRGAAAMSSAMPLGALSR